MTKRLIAHTAVCWLIAAGATSGLGNAQIAAVVAGTDYLQTTSGTQVTLPFGEGTVALHGVPITSTTHKYGSTDTAIVKETDAVFVPSNPGPDTPSTATVNIRMEALHLQGTLLDTVTGTNCTVNVTLAPTPPSVGQLVLTATSATGGTYMSTLTVNVQITFTPAASCYPPIPLAQCTMSQGKGTWSIHPVAGEFLVHGAYGDLAANDHTGRPAGYFDFYISSLQTDTSETALHAVCEAYQEQGQPCPSGTQPGPANDR
jgi:hypothetical protein